MGFVFFTDCAAHPWYMNEDELTTSDVLNDKLKDFRELYLNSDEDEDENETCHVSLFDSLYYTETQNQITHLRQHNVTICATSIPE